MPKPLFIVFTVEVPSGENPILEDADENARNLSELLGDAIRERLQDLRVDAYLAQTDFEQQY